MSGSTFPLFLSFVEGCAPFKTSPHKANLEREQIQNVKLTLIVSVNPLCYSSLLQVFKLCPDRS